MTWLWIRTQQKAWPPESGSAKDYRTVPGNLGGGEYPVVEEEGAEPLIVDHAHQSPQLAHDSLLVPRVHPQVLRTLIRSQQGQGKAETSNVKTTRTVFI